MAERGEGTGILGGSHSRTTTTTPTLSNSINRNQVVDLGVEGVGGTRSPLPLRKRKFAIAEVLQNKTSTDNSDIRAACIVDSTNSCRPIGNRDSVHSNNIVCGPTSSGKRRRVTSGSSTSDLSFGALFEECLTEQKISCSPAVKRQRRESQPDPDNSLRVSASPSLATQNPSTPSKHSGVAGSPSYQRRSSRGSYPIGFYAEEEQKLLAAFRDRTSELKSKGQTPEVVVSAGEVEARKRRSFKSNCKEQENKGVSLQSKQNLSNKSEGNLAGSKKTKNRRKKMTEKKPSWSSNEGKSFNKLKELNNESESICVAVKSPKYSKQRTSRRHTFPGRPEIVNSDMGVTLSKCLSIKAHDTNDQIISSNDATEPKPSTSGVANNIDDNLASSPATVFDQIMRRLPRKKKSNSEQDLSQVNIENASISIDGKKCDKTSASILRKHQDVKRRKSANLDQRREALGKKEYVESSQLHEIGTSKCSC